MPKKPIRDNPRAIAACLTEIFKIGCTPFHTAGAECQSPSWAIDSFNTAIIAIKIFLASVALIAALRGLRVCPETSGRIAKFSEHEAN
jgi:hypothetical protein